MRKRVLGKTGLRVSPLGFGGAPIGQLGASEKQIARILDELLESGVNLIDTAECYGNSERLLGRALRRRRDHCILVTKCGHRIAGLRGKEWSASLIRQSVDHSLRELGTDRLDVLLLHSCDLKTLQKGEAGGALLQAQEAGKVRFIGYSGDNEAAAFAADMPAMSVIETSINICDQENIDMVLPIARKRKVGVIAKRPIADAAWLPPDQHAGLYKDYSRPYTERLQQMKISPRDLGFDGRDERAWPELALRFTLAIEGVHIAIVGTTNPRNAAANVAAAEKGPLRAPAVRKIRKAFRAARKRSKKKWLGLT